MNVVLYTIGCSNCLILEKMLKDKDIKFLKVSDMETIKEKLPNVMSMPILEVDGVIMKFNTAKEWIKNI